MMSCICRSRRKEWRQCGSALRLYWSNVNCCCFLVLFCLINSNTDVAGVVNTLRPKRNGQHFADDIFKRIFLNENVLISIKISLKFAPKSPINNIPALVQIMAWRRSGQWWLVYRCIYASLGLNELNSLLGQGNGLFIMYHAVSIPWLLLTWWYTQGSRTSVTMVLVLTQFSRNITGAARAAFYGFPSFFIEGWCKTAVSPLLTHWRYCSVVPNHHYGCCTLTYWMRYGCWPNLTILLIDYRNLHLRAHFNFQAF